MFKEESGKLSYTRISGFIALVSYLVCMLFIVVMERKIPDIPPMLMTLILGLYGINKVVSVLGNRNKEQNKSSSLGGNK